MRNKHNKEKDIISWRNVNSSWPQIDKCEILTIIQDISWREEETIYNNEYTRFLQESKVHQLKNDSKLYARLPASVAPKPSPNPEK